MDVDVWDEQRFHAVKIPMRIVGAARGHETVEAIADIRAGLELAPEGRLSVEILRDTLQRYSTALARQGTANEHRQTRGRHRCSLGWAR